MSQTEAYFAHWVQAAVSCMAARSHDAERFPRQSKAVSALCWHSCEPQDSLHWCFSFVVRRQSQRTFPETIKYNLAFSTWLWHICPLDVRVQLLPESS